MLFSGRSLKKVNVCDSALLYNDLHDQVDGTTIITIFLFITLMISSVGFGNVASETDNEKIFSILMMIVAGRKSILRLTLK